MSKKCIVALPDFSLLDRQPKIPHVARVILKRDLPNQHGTPVTFTVRQARNGKSWWVSASHGDGWRASATIHTTKADKAKQWIDAIERGQICIKDRDK